jgi:hypothetical protein
LTFVPQVSVDAPTSGFVNNRFVVVVSAMMKLLCGLLPSYWIVRQICPVF